MPSLIIYQPKTNFPINVTFNSIDEKDKYIAEETKYTRRALERFYSAIYYKDRKHAKELLDECRYNFYIEYYKEGTYNEAG